MNKRSIVVGICVIAITVCALTFGKTSRFGPASVSVTPNPKPLARETGDRSTIKVSLNENKEVEVTPPASQTSGEIPDFVTYGYLFRSVMQFRLKAAEEEKQGRLGVGYTKVIQTTLKLNDTTTKALDDAVTEWTSLEQETVAKVESILAAYQSEKTKALSSGKQPPAVPAAELRQLYDKLNESILAVRDALREQLGEKEFEALEKSVGENIAANIKSKPFDANDPKLSRSRERTVFPRLSEIPPNAVPEGSMLKVHREPPPAKAPAPTVDPSGSKRGKRVAIGDSERAGSVSGLGQPRPQLNFCFFGGIVFYGSFVWLVPSIDQIVQISFTQLDFCAGLNFDPYVYSALYNSFTFDDGESFGRSFVRPAIVENHAFALPSTLYFVDGVHFILDCHFEIFCDWILVDAYTLFFTTPQCVHGSSLSMGQNFNVCPGPSPSPTPTPNVKISAVGFTGDFVITKWHGTPSQRKKIDPNQNDPTWSKSSNPKSPVAYKRGVNPTMFARFDVTPASSIARTAHIRVKKGTTIIATTQANIAGGNNVEVRDIGVTATALEPTPRVIRGDYKFIWEVSFDGGTNWANAGTSGTHEIFWTWDTPKSQPFKNIFGTFCFPTFDTPAPGCENDTLYDEALKHSVGETGNGQGSDLTNLQVIVANINEGLRKDVAYDPCEADPPEHPLQLLSPRAGNCSEHANLLRGMLKSIGIDAETHYFWGGDPATGVAHRYRFADPDNDEMTMQVDRRRNEDGTQCKIVQEDAHFSYHATVCAGSTSSTCSGGVFYDPSYGLKGTDAEVTLIEALNPQPPPDFLLGSGANSRKVTRLTFMSSVLPATKTCNHQLTAGVLFPNPIDIAQTFVAQHYWDFLNREADPGGLAHWTGQITQCNGEPVCVDFHRANTSLAFLLSPEFQNRSFFVHRFYKAAYGRNPAFTEEYLPDLGQVGHDAVFSEEALERNKLNYADEFVETEAFKAQYPFTMSFEQYVDTLFANAGVSPSPAERASMITGLENGTEDRATILRRVVDNQAFASAEYNRAFILLCYFSYLRRDPDIPGYNFWLGILNQENDQFHIAKAFVLSIEYRARFGLP